MYSVRDCSESEHNSWLVARDWWFVVEADKSAFYGDKSLSCLHPLLQKDAKFLKLTQFINEPLKLSKWLLVGDYVEEN